MVQKPLSEPGHSKKTAAAIASENPQIALNEIKRLDMRFKLLYKLTAMKIPFIDPSTRTEITGQENYKISNASKLDVNVSLHFRPQLKPGMILSLGWICYIYYKGKKQITFFRASNHSITEHDISPSDADLKKWVVGSFKRFSEQFEILRYNYRLSEVYFNDDALESNIDSLRDVLLPLTTQNKNIPACYQKITA